MDKLIRIIQTYESDTFTARGARITKEEATQVAQKAFDRLCAIAESGGQMFCDGVQIHDWLVEVRGSRRKKP